MAAGLLYDSDAGRACAAAVTVLVGGAAYMASAEIAKAKGPFAGYAKNRSALGSGRRPPARAWRGRFRRTSALRADVRSDRS